MQKCGIASPSVICKRTPVNVAGKMESKWLCVRSQNDDDNDNNNNDNNGGGGSSDNNNEKSNLMSSLKILVSECKTTNP